MKSKTTKRMSPMWEYVFITQDFFFLSFQIVILEKKKKTLDIIFFFFIWRTKWLLEWTCKIEYKMVSAVSESILMCSLKCANGNLLCLCVRCVFEGNLKMTD